MDDERLKITVQYENAEREAASMSRSWVLTPEEPSVDFPIGMEIEITAVLTEHSASWCPELRVMLEKVTPRVRGFQMILSNVEDEHSVGFPVQAGGGDILHLELPGYTGLPKMPSAYEIVEALERHPRLRERVRGLLNQRSAGHNEEGGDQAENP